MNQMHTDLTLWITCLQHSWSIFHITKVGFNVPWNHCLRWSKESLIQKDQLFQTKYKQTKHKWCKKHILVLKQKPHWCLEAKRQWFHRDCALHTYWDINWCYTQQPVPGWCQCLSASGPILAFPGTQIKTYKRYTTGVSLPNTPHHWKHPFLPLHWYLSSSCLWILSWSSRSLCSRARRRFSVKILAASSAVVVPATVLLPDSAKVKRICF